MAFNRYDEEDAAWSAAHGEAGARKRHRRNKRLEDLLRRCMPEVNSGIRGEIKAALKANFYSESDEPLPSDESLYPGW